MIATAFPAQQRLLVPMDFSESARVALRTALRLSNQPEDVVLIFYVLGLYGWTPLDRAALVNPFRVNVPEDYGRQLMEGARAANAAGVQAEALPLMGLPDAGVIAAMAQRTHSSLIVVVRRDYTLWQRLFGDCPLRTLPRMVPGRMLVVAEPKTKD